MTRIPERLIEALRRARRTVILTGAGVSAESGIPTFRDAQAGLWARYRPEDLASREAFQRDPELVWQWYQWRRELVAAAAPNRAHLAIAGLARILPGVTLVTQNVDGLHQRAGSGGVIELHGNIQRNRCSADDELVEIATTGSVKPPNCPRCGAKVRPDVVWFGEPVPKNALVTAQFAAEHCEVFLSVGTSAVVLPAAGLAHLARAGGAMLVEVNSAATAASENADLVLRDSASSAMTALVQAVSGG